MFHKILESLNALPAAENYSIQGPGLLRYISLLDQILYDEAALQQLLHTLNSAAYNANPGPSSKVNYFPPPKNGALFNPELFLQNSDRRDVAQRFVGTHFVKFAFSDQGAFTNPLTGERLISHKHGWLNCRSNGEREYLPLLPP